MPRSLVPPRPNRGPEPWPKDLLPAGVWIALAISVSTLFVWILWRLVRRRRARPGQDLTTPDEADVTPRGRLVALSMSTKNALAARFGPTWRAKTTEELAAEPALGEVLGPESLEELFQFFDRIDRLKFAPERPDHDQRSLQAELADWNPRVAGLVSRIQARTNGRSDKQVARRTTATHHFS